MLGFSAGGAQDLITRQLADGLSTALGQTFVVDNRPGQDSALAAQYVASQSADGYTILMGTSTNAIRMTDLTTPAGYDILNDFSAVSKATSSPLVAVAQASTATSLASIIAEAKVSPFQSIASGPQDGVSYHYGSSFELATGSSLLSVAFVTDAVALNAIGIADATFGIFPLTSAIGSLAADRRLRAIGISRMFNTPVVAAAPTFASQGATSPEPETWTGLLAPRCTPPDVLTKLHAAMLAVSQQPAYTARVMALGASSATSASPGSFALELAQEIEGWRVRLDRPLPGPLPTANLIELARNKNCGACHALDRKLIGPAFTAISERYRGATPDQRGLLEQKILNGGSGVWGQIPMPANPQVSPSEAQQLVSWILSL